MTRAAPIGFARREDLPWLLAPSESQELSAPAVQLRGLLEQRGASFWSELLSGAKLSADELEGAVWELVAAGELTCDGFAGMRALIQRARPMRAAPSTSPLSAGGRWSLLRRGLDQADVPGALEKRAMQLLRRYGVVFRDLLAREAGCPTWRELAQLYRRLEARGELRGGRFVAGFQGEQFALPGAVETLRAVRRAGRIGAEQLSLCAADPLNLVGILTPGARVPAVLQNRVTFVDGVPQELPGARAG